MTLLNIILGLWKGYKKNARFCIDISLDFWGLLPHILKLMPHFSDMIQLDFTYLTFGNRFFPYFTFHCAFSFKLS